jgi:hypothetical protein
VYVLLWCRRCPSDKSFVTNSVAESTWILEKAGQGRYAKGQFHAELDAVEIEDAQRQALIEGNVVALNASVGGRATMRCMVFSPD